MSFLVKGMKIPKNCDQCPLKMSHCKELCYKATRPEKCPLEEVSTPHGRLIDADAMEEDVRMQLEVAKMILSKDEDAELIIESMNDAVLLEIQKMGVVIEAEE